MRTQKIPTCRIRTSDLRISAWDYQLQSTALPTELSVLCFTALTFPSLCSHSEREPNKVKKGTATTAS
ncbi:hypothetical protein VNO80_11372 [Phaseolus coccineus]|uniref:Uncharacterized protein n=1 Tax=Phaseolus coccineus TaxID=3886 RepID=A0AAN9RBC4_PHACN